MRNCPYKADVGSSNLSTPTPQKTLIIIESFCFSTSLSYVIWLIAIIYSIFAILFGIVASNHPVSENKIDNLTSSEEKE